MKQKQININLRDLTGLTLCSFIMSYSPKIDSNENINNFYKIKQEQVSQLDDSYAMLLIYDSNPLSESNEKNETSLSAFTQFSTNTQHQREHNTYLFDCNEELFCKQFINKKYEIENIPALVFYCKGEPFRKFHRIPIGFVGVDQIAYGLELGYDHFLEKCENSRK